MDPRPELVCSGTVEGKPIDRVLLDTGAATTLIHLDLVPEDKMLPHTIDIRCTHGDVTCYPMAEVSMRVGGFAFFSPASEPAVVAEVTYGQKKWEELAELEQVSREEKCSPT